ncbi:MAG: glycosyltransferase family 39 protein [Weeksellaceae bacterium]
MHKYKTHIILLILFLIGFALRFSSISQQLSYWNDESHAAFFARAITQTGIPQTPSGSGTGIYQLGFYYVTALFFKLFGITELSGRLPSVLIGSLLIIVIFWITKKVSDTKSAFLASFLMAFSQIQLAWSTQLRPYIWLELFSLAVLYFSYKALSSKKMVEKNIIFASFSALISAFFHGTGLINLAFISIVFIYKCIRDKQYKYLLALIPATLIAALFLYFSFGAGLANIIGLFTTFHTYIVHYRVYLFYHYLWLLIGSGLGVLALWHKNKQLMFLLVGFISLIFFIAIFKINPRYVRYSLPAFPLLYMLFAIGLVNVSEVLAKHLSFKYNKIIILILLSGLFLAWPIKKGKMIMQPQAYYGINNDMRENPIVDYKSAFIKIEKLIGDREDVIVMDAWNDRVPWYLPDQPFVWINRDGKGQSPYGEKNISTPQQFEAIKKQYPAGIVIVENWESQTSPEMQDYIRRTLKEEFGEQTVKGNEKDSWSITVYSWGL